MKIFYDLNVKDINKLFVGLFIFEIFLVIAYVGGLLLDHPTKFFNFNGEANLPSWFSSTQYLLIGLVFLVKRDQCNTNVSPSRFFFLMGAIGFIFLSADEAAQVHETMNGVIQNVNWLPRFKGGNGIWIFIYGLFGLALLLYTFRDIFRMWQRYRRQTSIMVIGFIILVIGSAGLEAFGYEYLSSRLTPLAFMFEAAGEEFLEMLGVSIILYGALLLLLDKDEGQ